MARLPRYFAPDQPQHVILRGNNRQIIFACDADYAFFRDCFIDAAGRFGLTVHSYVWMTNHVHLLATPDAATSLPKTMQSVGRRYVQYFNAAYKRSGTLWEGRYRATPVDSERYLFTCMRYIEENPVRAGLAATPEDYRWSSYSGNAMGRGGANYDWLQAHLLYVSLGPNSRARRDAYRALFGNPIQRAELDTIRTNTHRGWALGSEKFRAEVEKLTHRRAAPLTRGRPRRRR